MSDVQRTLGRFVPLEQLTAADQQASAGGPSVAAAATEMESDEYARAAQALLEEQNRRATPEFLAMMQKKNEEWRRRGIQLRRERQENAERRAEAEAQKAALKKMRSEEKALKKKRSEEKQAAVQARRTPAVDPGKLRAALTALAATAEQEQTSAGASTDVGEDVEVMVTMPEAMVEPDEATADSQEPDVDVVMAAPEAVVEPYQAVVERYQAAAGVNIDEEMDVEMTVYEDAESDHYPEALALSDEDSDSDSYPEALALSNDEDGFSVGGWSVSDAQNFERIVQEVACGAVREKMVAGLPLKTVDGEKLVF